MAEVELMTIPSGMLRITKEGEAERVIYPVHAEGWRQQGWTVHVPPPELDGEEPDSEGWDGEGPDREDGGHGDDGHGDGGDRNGAIAAGPAGGGSGSTAPPLPVVLHPERDSAGPDAAVLPLERMTKAQIVAAVRERHGVLLDDSSTRSELLAQARELEAQTTASGTETRGEGLEAGTAEAADHEPGPDAEAEVVVPTLLI
jgi:hypothetical protein